MYVLSVYLLKFIKNRIKSIAVEVKQGLIKMEEIRKIMSKHGKYEVISKSYQLFKAGYYEKRLGLQYGC